MRVLLYSGLLYLLGVSIVLALKPTLMFTEDGGWKEFGIGRDPERYTWLPVWMFVLFWAVLSFFIVQAIGSFGVLPGVEVGAPQPAPQVTQPAQQVTQPAQQVTQPAQQAPQPVPQPAPQMKPGYYMLNTEGTAAEGIPRYVYIGPKLD
jgi:hypothetical protein